MSIANETAGFLARVRERFTKRQQEHIRSFAQLVRTIAEGTTKIKETEVENVLSASGKTLEELEGAVTRLVHRKELIDQLAAIGAMDQEKTGAGGQCGEDRGGIPIRLREARCDNEPDRLPPARNRPGAGTADGNRERASPTASDEIKTQLRSWASGDRDSQFPATWRLRSRTLKASWTP